MAQQSARRGRENQCFPQCFEHALGEMDQARELPYRPAAAQRRTRGRTDGSIRLRVTAILQFSLTTKGASTDGKPPFAPDFFCARQVVGYADAATAARGVAR